jgi:death on curing protein
MSEDAWTPDFLTIDDVLIIHEDQIERFGGTLGVRSRGLLESALAQPQVSFEGVFVHQDLFEMAAAYLFHLTSNHPFLDGNKRAGLASALVFLELNGVEMTQGTEALYQLTMSVACGTTDKQSAAHLLRSLAFSNAP